jgi:hypothetical protein
MTQSQNHPPKSRRIPARDLNAQERAWIQEIVNTKKLWSDVDLGTTKVVAECDCGECQTVFLDSPQNPLFRGTRGYIGRIEITTNNKFGITVALDQLDGKLYGLYVNALDLTHEGSRPFPDRWVEIGHIVVPM